MKSLRAKIKELFLARKNIAAMNTGGMPVEYQVNIQLCIYTPRWPSKVFLPYRDVGGAAFFMGYTRSFAF